LTKNSFFKLFSSKKKKTSKHHKNHPTIPKQPKMTQKNEKQLNPKNQNQTRYAYLTMFRKKNHHHQTFL